ncbi:YdeI/OmpD-associated family protein [Mycolicibacterium mucogenicum]|uniref:DUF1905 domain-containing protein n=1 Tax=Mycolicibacterium mucogenicum TaxID=56689 RepID=A0A4R5W8L5_MYCMU|nr:YdeI/OmpD-associated family protein [Mycolicibacterium mucogenicum]TDK85206.1 DUF1905 domain-containing protein [Mycolicibacterium mucogenicum]
MRFRTELESAGKTATGFEVPEEIVQRLGGGGHPKVTVTVNGFTFRTSIAKMGGRFLLGVSADRRTQAGIAAGQTLDVDVVLDTEARQVDLPDDLVAALAADARARTFWDTLSHSKQSWHVHQVTSAKKAETRAARVRKSVAMLSEGRARPS